MRKLINIMLVLFIVLVNFFGVIDVNAYEPNTIIEGNTIINRINDSEDVARSLINKLTTWSNSHASKAVDVIDRSLINSLGFAYIDIETFINKLNSKGYTTAANEFESLNIKPDIEYLKETLDMIEYYLENNVYTDDIDETDILFQCRKVGKRLTSELEDLARIYYNLYYDEIDNRINNLNGFSELLDVYYYASGKFVDNNDAYLRIEQQIAKIRNLYVAKNLEIFEPALKVEIDDYYQKFGTDYNVLYNKLVSKLQTKLDERINSIIDGVDLNSIDEITAANNKLYEIIDKISEVQDDVDDRINQINELFEGINVIIEYLTPYENQIKTRLQEANDYTRSKLLSLNSIIEVKNEADKKYIEIDNASETIIYDTLDLTPSVLVNKLHTNYDYFDITNTYNSNLGTLSKLRVYYQSFVLKTYNIIVKGDTNGDGKISYLDYVNIYNHIQKAKNPESNKKLLVNEFLIAAEMSGDGKISYLDYVKVYNRIKELKGGTN